LLEQPVFFGKKNNTDLKAATKEHLNAVVAILKKYPQSGIVMKGHT
jgi:outer membrane protein OmpA-like peptidoglycan-associated protein